MPRESASKPPPLVDVRAAGYSRGISASVSIRLVDILLLSTSYPAAHTPTL